MTDIPLEGREAEKPKEPVTMEVAKPVEHVKHTERKPIPSTGEPVVRGMMMNSGNFEQVITIMIETLNKNIVELNEILKLTVPEEKLKKHYQDRADALNKAAAKKNG